MANLPTLKSKNIIVGDLIQGFTSRQPQITDLNTGSILLSLFEAVGQSNFRSAANIISMIDALSIDRATGEALRRLAADNNVPILPALASSGLVDITDTTFTKVSTQIYPGQPSPVAGSVSIYISSNSGFPAAGQIYLGRGTANAEGPLTYTSITPQGGGSYYLVSLSSSTPTANFHNAGETVVLSQHGARTVPNGTVVQTPSNGPSVNSISFVTTAAANILDGEVTVTGVPIICQLTGTQGNVPTGAITTVTGLPFLASANNPQPFVNGRPADNEDQIKSRIKAYNQAKAKGTSQAIQSSAINVTAPDDLKTVTSANVVTQADNTVDLVYDDGSGYECPYQGIGYETIVDSAVGGEIDLQLRQVPLAQSRLITQTSGPYPLYGNEQLAIEIAGTVTTHIFQATDFQVPGAATALEIVASINGDAGINFSATTFNGNTTVIVYPKESAKNDIVLAAVPTYATDASSIIGLPSSTEYTLRLYKNGSALYEDGLFAQVSTLSQSSWSNTITDGDTLTYQVDNTPAVTVTFTNAAFQAVNPTSSVNSTTSIATWVSVMNNLMPGITASTNGSQINLISNLGESTRASVAFTGGTLLNKIFQSGANLTAVGQTSDYTLNRMTGQIELVQALLAGDNLTAGVSYPYANVTTSSLPNGNSNAGRFWCVADGSPEIVASNLKSSSNIYIAPSTTSTQDYNIYTQSSSLVGEGFELAEVGDWVIFWADTDTTSLYSYQIVSRITRIQYGVAFPGTTGGTSNQITLRADPNTSLLTKQFTIAPSRFVIVRTAAPIQRVEFASNLSLIALAESILSQLVSVNVDFLGSAIRIASQQLGSSGSFAIVAADSGANNIGLFAPTIAKFVYSGQGFSVTSDSEAGTPNFNNLTVINTPTYGAGLTEFVDGQFLNNMGTVGEMLDFLPNYDVADYIIKPANNRDPSGLLGGYRTLIDFVTPDSTNTPPMSATVFLRSFNYMLPDTTSTFGSAFEPTLRSGDRYFLRAPYQFDSTDTATVTVDNNAIAESYSAPVSRTLVIDSTAYAASTPTTTTFFASDAQSSLALNNPSSFENFDFTDFKVWRQANTTLTNGTYSVLFQNPQFGPSGNAIRVGFVYPTLPTQTSLSYTIAPNDIIDIGIILPVATPRTGSWNGNTAFTVTAGSAANGIQTLQFTYRAGTAPNFTSAGIIPGDVVIISPSSGFVIGDRGISGLVTSVNNTSFTVTLPANNYISDNFVFSTVLSDYSPTAGRTTTLTIPSGNLQANIGDLIGLYNTAQVSSGNNPFNSTYSIIATNGTTSITVQTPSSSPGANVSTIAQNGNTVTVSAIGHGLSANDVIRVNQSAVSGFNVYGAVRQVIDANNFTYVVPDASLGSASSGHFEFQSYGAGANTPFAVTGNISKSNTTGLVTVNATNTLSAGNIVNITGSNVDPWYTTFTFTVTSANATAGAVYSNGSATFTVATTISSGTTLVTKSFTGNLPASSGTLTKVSGTGDPTITYSAYAQSTPYASGDVVSYLGSTYLSLVATNLALPTVATNWQNITAKYAGAGGYFNGTFVVVSATGSSFTFYHDQKLGNAADTSATATVTLWTAQASLARSVGAQANYLSFGQVSTTSQAVVDYVSTNMSGILNASLNGSNGTSTINTSTYDLDYTNNYITPTGATPWVSIKTFLGSRKAIFTLTPTNYGSQTPITVGTTLFLSGSGQGYDGSYTVLSVITNGTSYYVTVQTNILGTANTTLSCNLNATYYGLRQYQMLQDGENFVNVSDLNYPNPIGHSWQFQTKNAWATVPFLNEQLKLVAYTSDQITRFWNKTIVTGLSNVAQIQLTKYGRNVQINTDTYGSLGSIQVSGGTANSGFVALSTSAQNLNGRVGEFKIPLALLKGMNAGFWIKLAQTVKLNKKINFANTTKLSATQNELSLAVATATLTGTTSTGTVTSLELNTSTDLSSYAGSVFTISGILASSGYAPNGQFIPTAITSGTITIQLPVPVTISNLSLTAISKATVVTTQGTFQTKRNTTQSNDTVWAVEKYGNFIGFTYQSGTSPNLIAAGVQEGDWVRIKNTSPIVMSGSTTTQPLQTGQKISVNNNTYVAIQPVPYNHAFSDTTSLLPYAAWNASNNYSTTGTTASTSPYVSFDGRLYKALSNNTNQQPDVSPLVWKQLEFSLNNNGIYRVVRSWGDNFWVEIPNAVEELTTLQDPTDLQFFSYDSIMPNDILTVGTPLLGSTNVASYTVLDDNGTSSFFPSNFNLYVTPTFAATSYALTASACNVTAGAVYSGTSTTGTTLLFTITTTGNGLTTITGSSNGLLTPGGTLIKSTGGNAGDTTIIVYTSFAATGSGPVQLNNDYPLITIQDSQVLTSYKRILSIGPDSSALASVIVDSPELIDRFSPTYGAYVQMQNKLNFGTTINYGLDAYKTYQGLTRELVRVIYGDPTSPADYPGVRAAGAYVEPKPAQILRINTISLAIRLNTGISFVDIRDRIKAAVAAYVNSLNVGEAVSLSSVIAAASSIVGVESVSLNSPYYSPTSDRIIVGANEVAKVITPTTDIILTSLTS